MIGSFLIVVGICLALHIVGAMLEVSDESFFLLNNVGVVAWSFVVCWVLTMLARTGFSSM